MASILIGASRGVLDREIRGTDRTNHHAKGAKKVHQPEEYKGKMGKESKTGQREKGPAKQRAPIIPAVSAVVRITPFVYISIRQGDTFCKGIGAVFFKKPFLCHQP
jgi:hypothetical protein